MNTARHFEGLLDRYFERVLEDDPILAAMSGLRDGEGRLPVMSAAAVARRERHRQATLRALDALSPRELSGEQHLDRLALRSLLRRECEDFARGRHALEPAAPSQFLEIVLHELVRGEYAPARAAANVRSLLRAAPRYFAEAATLLARPERVWLKIMDETVAGAGQFLDGAGKFLEQTGAEPSDAASLRAARKALDRYRDAAKGRPFAPEGAFAIGASALQRRVREELGLDYTLGEIEALAHHEAERVGALLARECARFGRGRTAGDLTAELRAQWRPARPLLELYQETTARVAEAFRARQAVTFPEGDELVVRPVPDFLRPMIATAAYSHPGAFERRQRGTFWVNDLSLAKATAAERLAEQQQHFGMPLTCVHEARPGHHLQLVTANRHPRRWRRLFAHAVFYEGWTLWCEQMTVDLGVGASPAVRVQQLHDALWRVHRILVDLRLQTGRYSHAQATRHLQRRLHFTRARAEADVNWYSTQPAIPMSYWLGRLENDRLRRRLMDGRGWSLRRFNDWLLSFGSLPQSWLEKHGLD